ncbi:Glucose-repressible alcohol dehydrogenase transcriptional effector [Verticillium dahliae VDG1]|nr:Glucose-repressible alcohol dehydrogenase transcriptional effector [Verticillium dahliae VDG1]
MTSRPPNHDTTEEELSRRRNFKKHKVLPHPSRQRENAGKTVNDQRSSQARRTLSSSDAQSRKKTSQSPNSPTLKHQSRRIRSGPVMPPTPPAHSRTSSSSHSIQLHSPTDPATPSQSLEKASTHLERPTTPQNQQSPPTPDVTPPQPATRPKALRPVFGDRSISKPTTSESRTESFRTAREEPYSSEDDCKSTISQHKVKKASQLGGIGLGLDFDPKTDDSLTPRTKGEFIKFDAGWESPNEVEKEWDDNLGRHVMQRLTPEDRMVSTDLKSTPSFFSAQEDYMHARPNVHRPDAESYSGKRLSHQNTPFSVASLDTNGSFGTAAEVSEALAVSIYPHQNSSLLMVHHAVKPNDDGDVFQDRAATENNDLAPEMPGAAPARPKIVTTSPGGSVPVTPPQTQLALEQVDSPLKNPRAPPVPPTLPAIQFIPATPSGLTPFHERQEMRGNYFEAMEEDEKPPKRSMSLVRRALLQHRRTSEAYPPKTARPGFLTRTLSLSRSNRRDASTEPLARDSPYPNIDDPPADGSKLHPFWRPAYADDEGDNYVRDIDDEEYYYEANRKRPGPQRSLSARMKRTFAILPQRDQHGYRSWSGEDGLDRRIIRRTPSGNLRVVRRRKSAESIPRQSDRPYTSDGTSSSRFLWPARGRPRGETPSTPRRRFSVSHTIEEIQGLPRRLSERRRERRTHELRQKISGPREVRDGVGEVVRSGSQRSHREVTEN